MQYLHTTAAALNLKSTLTGPQDRRAFCDFVAWVLADKQFGVQQYFPKVHQKAVGNAVSLFQRLKDDPGIADEIDKRYSYTSLVSGSAADFAYYAGSTLMSCAGCCAPSFGSKDSVVNQAAQSHEAGFEAKKGTVRHDAFLAKAREKLQSIIAEHTPPAMPDMDF